MPTLLDRLPYFEQGTEVIVAGERVRIRPHQIVIWVSLGPRPFAEPDPAWPRFPAILDTGHNHSLSIQELHLRAWARMQPEHMPMLRRLRESRRVVPLRAAALWIYRNEPGQRDRLTAAPPYRVAIPQGVAVYPSDDPPFPRLPLLGLRALTENELRLTIDGRGRRVGLRTPRHWWPWG